MSSFGNTEGNGTGYSLLSFTVRYHGEPTPFTVDYETSDGTALAGSDYETKSGTLAFSGASGEERTVTVNVVKDHVVELTEALFLSLSNATAPDIELPAPTSGLILNDDDALISIVLEPSVPEAEDGITQEGTVGGGGIGGSIWYRVTINEDVDVPVTVSWDIYHGTSETGDFRVEHGSVVIDTALAFGPGGATPLTITAEADNRVETNETFSVVLGTISAGGRAVFLDDSSESGTITDDDLFAVDVFDCIESEGTGGTIDGSGQFIPDIKNFPITVRLERPVEGGVMIQLAAEDYTANASLDYGWQSAVVYFDEGELVKTVEMPVYMDQDREANEKFNIKIADYGAQFPLNTGTRYQYSNPWGQVTILNNDQGPYSSSSGTKRVAFYHGGDPGAPGYANGARFEAAANYYYDDVFNVDSWAGLITALEAYVAVHGRVDEIGIFDHGMPGAQQLGNTDIVNSDWEDLAPLVDDGGTLRLYGCNVGKLMAGLIYCDWAADDAGPGWDVIACDNFVDIFPDGHLVPRSPGQFLTFDGIDGGYHP